MSITATLVNRPITLDQLVALCDEIAALARAGVPLDRGLVALARELPGRLGTVAGDIGQRLAAGESLEQIVGQSDAQFPPAFRAVIAAGQRSGQLPAAVQDVARTARRLSQLRTTLSAVLIYPLLVLLVAWLLFEFTILKIVPVMVFMLVEVHLIDASWQAGARDTIHTIAGFGVFVPPVLLIWAAWVWYRSGRAGPRRGTAPATGLERAGQVAADAANRTNRGPVRFAGSAH